MQTHKDTYANTQRHICKHTKTHTQTHKDTYANTQRYICKHMQTHIYANTSVNTPFILFVILFQFIHTYTNTFTSTHGYDGNHKVAQILIRSGSCTKQTSTVCVYGGIDTNAGKERKNITNVKRYKYTDIHKHRVSMQELTSHQ